LRISLSVSNCWRCTPDDLGSTRSSARLVVPRISYLHPGLLSGHTAYLILFTTRVSCQPYLMNRRNDDLGMFGWHFVAAVDDDLLAMGRETSQLQL
jgi:hypothetical protein